MLANFDYPFAEETFGMKVESEVRELLTRFRSSFACRHLRRQRSFQQGAMLGLPKSAWNGAFFQETLARLARRGGRLRLCGQLALGRRHAFLAR